MYESRHLRLVRPSLPSYVRPFERDFSQLARLIAEGRSVGSGVIVDPRDLRRSESLRAVAIEAQLEVVLDPLSVELSTPLGFERRGMATLPWASDAPHRPENFTHFDIQRYAERLAETVMATGVPAVLAPTHILDATSDSRLDVDVRLSQSLRKCLDRLGGEDVLIYYPLVVRLRVVPSRAERDSIVHRLRPLTATRSADAIWLRVPGFGVPDSGPVNLRRYIELARALHELRLPIISERTGTIGLAFLAFGAVGGIEQGVTFGERYDVRPLLKPRSTRGGFMPAPRVYVPEIGIFMSRRDAEVFLANRAVRNRFACQRPCCPRGVEDMLRDPRRHFLVSRATEVYELSSVPQRDRADYFLETWLRPASDRATFAVRMNSKLTKHRVRLDRWRETLSDVRARDRRVEPSVSLIPRGKRIHEHRNIGP